MLLQPLDTFTLLIFDNNLSIYIIMNVNHIGLCFCKSYVSSMRKIHSGNCLHHNNLQMLASVDFVCVSVIEGSYRQFATLSCLINN